MTTNNHNEDELVRRIRLGNLDARDFLIVQLQTTGGDPSHLFEVLEDIVKNKRWNEIIAEDGQPVGSFRRLLEAPQPTGCGVSADKVLKLLEIEHRYEQTNTDWHERMTALRNEVGRLLNEELPVIPSRGAPRGNENAAKIKQENKGYSITIDLPRGDNPDYKLRRLKRDNPELAQKVIDGELSAYEAAIQAGISTRKVALNMDNPESAARTIYKYMSQENIDDLIDRLCAMPDKD